jgi:HEAT repeat protein
MKPEPAKQQDAQAPQKKTMSVDFEDREQLARFCWFFLRNVLKDAEWRTRACAAWGIGLAADRLPPEVAQPALKALAETAADIDGFVRFWVVDAIGKLGDEAQIPLVRSALNDKDDYVRINAAKVLCQLGQPDGSRMLIQTLGMTPSVISTSSPDPRSSRRAWKLKVFAIECLGEIGSLAAIPHINSMLREQQWPIRASSAWALGIIGDKKAVPNIRPLLHDREKLVRISAAEALGRLGEEGGIVLLKAFLVDENKMVKYKAAESLAKIGFRTGVELLTEALKDSDNSIQSLAVSALGKLGDVTALKPLTAKLECENWQVRADVAVALGRIGDADSLPLLKKKLEDPVKNVRVCSAAASLMVLGK